MCIGVTGFILGVLAGLSYTTLIFSVIYTVFLSADSTSYAHGFVSVMVSTFLYDLEC